MRRMSRRTFGSVRLALYHCFPLRSQYSHYPSDNTDAKEENRIASVLEQNKCWNVFEQKKEEVDKHRKAQRRKEGVDKFGND
jgi:hypothetical protein